jgi:hypothetical protein
MPWGLSSSSWVFSSFSGINLPCNSMKATLPITWIKFLEWYVYYMVPGESIEGTGKIILNETSDNKISSLLDYPGLYLCTGVMY